MPTRRRFLAATALAGVLAGCAPRVPGDVPGGAAVPPPGTRPLGLEGAPGAVDRLGWTGPR